MSLRNVTQSNSTHMDVCISEKNGLSGLRGFPPASFAACRAISSVSRRCVTISSRFSASLMMEPRRFELPLQSCHDCVLPLHYGPVIPNGIIPNSINSPSSPNPLYAPALEHYRLFLLYFGVLECFHVLSRYIQRFFQAVCHNDNHPTRPIT